MWFDFSFGVGALVIVVILVASSIKILREYERAVVFLLGRFQAVKGPGLIIIIPVIQQMVRVDLRTVVLDVPPQDVITRDNVSVKVNAVVYFRVVDAQHAIIQVVNFLEATSQLAQTTLRAVLGKHELDELLSEREKLNLDIQAILDSQTNAWGIKVSNVEIKHVDLNETMVRAIARQAEAERERRAKVIHAEGELQASEKLLQAATMLAQRTEAMQLRFLLQRAHVAAARDLAALEELAVASEDDAALFVGKAADFAVLQAVMEKRVVTQHAQKTRQAAEVRVRQEQIGCFSLSRTYLYQVAVADHALQGRRLAIDAHRADLGVRHAERLDGVFQARSPRTAELKGSISFGRGEELPDVPEKPETRGRAVHRLILARVAGSQSAPPGVPGKQ